jgi:hypothetical protein
MRRNRDQGEVRRQPIAFPGKTRARAAAGGATSGSEICPTVPPLLCLRRLTSRSSSTRRGLANGIVGAPADIPAPRRRRRGGYRGAVQHRQPSKLGERRGIRGRGGRAHIVADAAAGRAQAPAPGDSRRPPQTWHSICESGMNGKPAWSPVPEPAPRDLEAAATL